MIQVQVKTSSTWQRPSWLLGAVQLSEQRNEWFVLVALGATERDRPRCFVIPRDHLAAAVWMGHNAWLHEPGVRPGRRNTPIERARTGADMLAGYEERWDLLGMKIIPVLLESKWRERAAEDAIGLPPEHPWRIALPKRWPGPK